MKTSFKTYLTVKGMDVKNLCILESSSANFDLRIKGDLRDTAIEANQLEPEASYKSLLLLGGTLSII